MAISDFFTWLNVPREYNHILMGMSVFLTLSPYLLYTWAYKWPRSLSRFLTQKQFIAIAQWAKIIDLLVATPTIYQAGINPAGMCVGIPIMFVGQYLSELVYSVLGDAGVYYGLEFKSVRPRQIKGFPFTIADPMYKGSILTILGSTMCFNVTRDMMIITIPWMISYFYEICVENTKPACG